MRSKAESTKPLKIAFTRIADTIIFLDARVPSKNRAALMIISLTNLTAQDSTTLNPSVSRSFDKFFPGAQRVVWSMLPKKISQAQFYHLGNSSIAYFDHEGKLVARGRRIKTVNNLPMKIQTGLLQQQKRAERKLGAFAIALIYEMITDDVTKYFITLENTKATVTVSVNTDGYGSILKKKMKNVASPAIPKDAIAKKK